ncbi:TraR/DksA C4-type zinc finger protein [uncultured Kiloniella sp.]|uniref:TraR/DksA C4-type zinc finger protein n=1 Tax=uncultured Kiloniella sp. TaxID=1133091 RepID=UPI002637EFAD|nr:TraR/DksA C4-type zinc finger protein [uncultured Kiloniella sp.]
MVDHADKAQDLIQSTLTKAIAANKAALAQGITRHEECFDCGDPISVARQKAIPGTTLCAYCKEAQEREYG